MIIDINRSYFRGGARKLSLFGSSIAHLQHGLDYASLKNQTIANNIANVDTSNYKAKDVQFKSLLDQEMNQAFRSNRTHEKHLEFGSHQTGFKINRSNTQYNHNGNNVDIDKEMTNLANNQIYQHALVDRVNGEFNLLQTVIRGGR